MVVTRQNTGSANCQILAQGNFSLDASGLLIMLAALATVTLGLAGLLAWQGYWPILVIAVIQIALVSLIFIRAWERAWVSEVIDVRPERIEVRQQRHKKIRRFELDPAWAVVELEPAKIAWYGPRLHLRSRNTTLELGAFLTSEEKRQLAMYLRSAIRHHSAL
ncbi:MAG: DUF2244 domain-containing protein [Xanthomonadales bacterium]|nr:DUF2244 domain-containing protein [Xanthomonadales bacterium]